MMIVLTWLHLLAAVSWIGGMVFLSLVFAPVYRGMQGAPEVRQLFVTTARRFRIVVWSSVAILLFTGPLLLGRQNLSLGEPDRWPPILVAKLSLVLVLLCATAIHDFILGPRVRQVLALPREARTAFETILLFSSSWIPRLAILIAFAVLLAAVGLVRS